MLWTASAGPAIASGRSTATPMTPSGNRAERDGRQRQHRRRYAYDRDLPGDQTTDPLGRATTYAIRSRRQLLTMTDRNGQRDELRLRCHQPSRPHDRRAGQRDASFSYDAVGNLTQLTDANGHATSYTTMPCNRRMTESYRRRVPKHLRYDSSATSPVAPIRTARRRPTATTISTSCWAHLSESAPTDNFTYDLSGRMLSAERGGWLVTLSLRRRQPRHQHGAERQDDRLQLQHPGANPHALPIPAAASITEHMDARSRLARSTTRFAHLVQYSYDLGDRVLTRAYRNGTRLVHATTPTTGRPRSSTPRASTRIAGFDYDYDNEGNKSFEEKRPDAATRRPAPRPINTTRSTA